MSELIVGPVLDDIARANFSGDEAILATAFYTSGPLEQLEVACARLRLLVRLDMKSLHDWVNRALDPEALLAFVDRVEAAGVSVDLRRSRSAHGKAYLGQTEFLVGSANFTANGLSGRRHEMLWRETRAGALREARLRMAEYAGGLDTITTAQLRSFVAVNKAKVLAARAQRPPLIRAEELPDISAPRPARFGTYDDFISWASRQPSSAARTIVARYRGKSNLSGHARNCFYGGRQLLLRDPRYRRRLLAESPDTYRVFADAAGETRVRRFAVEEVVDEPHFRATVFRNILPIELGGQVGKRGGSIGSLNKMLPLLARYLDERLR